MLYYVLIVLYVMVCLLLLTVILLQQGRAGDIASAFGGSSSQTVFGARSGATMLTRATTVLAVLFMVGSLGLAIAFQKGPSSVVSGVKLPSAPTAPAAPAPSTPPAPAK
ncbi:MAG TPA: preprotein translocase subunit SecG [Vicinamibacterales bacterium]|nr:preprotein translocase subunit SecG [Vicinamibacterales bacterium]HPW21661.1 preprotein translocase subunit SecG [Vicinamibacterales bacterium]